MSRPREFSDEERAQRIKARSSAQSHAFVVLARRHKREYEALYYAALRRKLAEMTEPRVTS